MKKLLVLLILTCCTTLAIADISGNGCKIGHDYVYTQYLGTAPAYNGTPPIIYYKSNGPKIPIYWGYGFNEHQGYRCGYINVYGASSYYDYEKKQNVPIPAENEFNYLGKQCVIAPYLGAPPVATDSYVSYSYMKTDKCNPVPTPLDNYTWFILIGTAILGTVFLKVKSLK
ncbi:hypothetical protein WG904_00195 [Pedobacter sp. Du54]|uniref:hypothetical protein n=1 Tax=Pedobacter anseongensis TaxID=3133439 RepID=UPI003096967F